MNNKFTTTTSIYINAPQSRVWQALVDPDMVKQYLYGTTMTTTWKIGDPIVYVGEWEGKAYEDHGVVLTFDPESLIETTYWSGFSGLADVPENYQKISYALSPQENGVEVQITQDNIASEEMVEHSKKSWGMVLAKMKEMLEN